MRILEEYIAAEKTGIRKKALEKLNFLIDELGNDPSFEECLSILAKLEIADVPLRLPLFSKVIFPATIQALEKQNDIRAIKVLLKYYHNLQQLKISSPLANLTEMELCDYGLSKWPDDRVFLEKKRDLFSRYLEYTLHELPAGVLYHANGASPSECDELIKILEEYKKLLKKLDREDENLVESCSWHYEHYSRYLHNHDRWGSYENYIKENWPEK